MTDRRFALVAGGGTGGHLVPALAVARALGGGLAPDAVELVGSRRGLDAQLLASEPFPVTLLPGRGIRRRVDPASLVSNVVAVLSLAAALVAAVTLVARRRPAVVVAMGGYASVPVALAAVLWRVPIVLVNVDAVPGAANRLVGRFAAAAAVAFPGTPLRHAVVTGAPVRPEIVAAARPSDEERAAARQQLGLPASGAVVGAVGGSLGARRINEAVLELARRWTGVHPEVAIYHVVGRRDWPWAVEAATAPAPDAARAPDAAPARRAALAGGASYRQVEYESRMDVFYRAADVVVCRAGANTVAELAAVGVAGVLVPLPGAPGDHQTKNALALVDAGAAVLLPDERCTGDELASLLEPLLADPGRLRAMREAAAALGRPDAVGAVADLARATAKRSGS